MSRDVQLAWHCPHLTLEENVALGTDRVSLPTKQPVGGAGTVRIVANDELVIPQSGLYVSAQLFSSESGPYDLTANEDTLTVETPRGSESVGFGTSNVQRLTADQVVQYLLRQQFTVALPESINGHLVFTDTSRVGIDSFVKVTGTAAKSLGFGTPSKVGNCAGTGTAWRASGRRLYPGWTLQVRPDTITNRYPIFNEPVRTNPTFAVSYTVPPQRCLRCGASYVENDYRYDLAGQTLMIENESLLYQAVMKILLTDRGSNPYFPWYGSQISSRIGSKALGGVASLLNEDVRRALARYQTLQESQSKYQSVTFKERLYAVLGVRVAPHEQDPTTFLLDVTVQNAAAEPINLPIVFTVPGVVATMGSNGLMLGQQAAGLAEKDVVNIPNSAVAQINGGR